MQQRDMSITDYTLKIKELCNALGSINVAIYDEEMVHICLGSLAPRFGMIKLAILVRENPPFFFDLQLILLVEGTMRLMVRCSTHSQTIEEDLAVEIEVGSDEADTVVRPKSVTFINGKTTERVPESLANTATMES